MYQSGKLMLYNLLIILTISLLIGWALGYPREALIAALLGWALYQVYLFQRVMKWLKREDGTEPPEAPGVWGDLLDGLYRLQRRGLDKEKALKGIISRFQHSSAALQDAVVIIDKKDNLEWWNKSAEKLLGLSAKTDRRRSILNLLRDPRFIRYYKKRHYHDPLELNSPINEQITLQYHITLFGQGDRLLVARDISRLKKLEQTRQSFVSNASHELRTPLTVIRGYLETFLDQALPSPILRGMKQMEQQTQRMEGLVRDMLMLSRLESTEHLTEDMPVDIQLMLKEIKRDALVLSGDKQHRISIEVDPNYDLLGQDNELYSAFSNLVFNAVRYTPAGSEIRIVWHTDAQGGYLSVYDNGPGIEAFHIPRLTERFYRVDEGRASESGGTGLGLSIVKYVMVRHGGQLKIHSTLGKGSCFSCHFPADMLIALEKLVTATDNA
jgi:two-component system phosphate regulon sensor histidine kinase PhoR